MWFDARGGDVYGDKLRRARRTGSAQSCPGITRSRDAGECRPVVCLGVPSGRWSVRRLRRLKVSCIAPEELGRVGRGIRGLFIGDSRRGARLRVRLGVSLRLTFGAWAVAVSVRVRREPLLLARVRRGFAVAVAVAARAVLLGGALECFVDSAHYESPLPSQSRNARPSSSASGALPSSPPAPSSSRSTSRSWLA